MKLKTLLLVLVFATAFLVRFYDLGIIPDGLSQDETSLGYNAYSILKTGKDEYGKPWPVEFKAFGEYKLPGYIYLSVPAISAFGPTPFAIRLPSAVFGFLTVVLFYFLLRKLSKNDWLTLVGAALFALNPWHVYPSSMNLQHSKESFKIL